MLSLRFKILIVATMLVLVSQIGTVLTVLVTANRDVADRATRTLVAGADVLKQTNVSRAAQFGNTVLALATDYGFRQAVATGDSATVESALSNHANRAGADVAFLFDTNGVLIASTGDAPSDAVQARMLDSVRNGVRGHTGLVRDDTAFEIFTVPIRSPLPVAWLSMGFVLTDEYASQLRDLTGLDVSIVTTGSHPNAVVASSLTGPVRNALAGEADIASAGRPMTVRIADKDHLTIGVELIDTDGPLTVVLSNSLADAMAPYRLMRSAAIALGAIPLILALAGAVLLSRALTRPIRKLVDAARRMQGGNYEQPVDIRTGDELQEFAVAFNSMQDEIARREERISYQIRHDSLTGLINRDHALTRLQDAIAHARTISGPLAVMVIDLNVSTEIAGTLGHDIADAYLKQAAERIRSLLATDFTLARLETDSFLAILPGLGAEDARDVAEQMLAGLEGGVGLPDINISVRPSFGIAIFPQHGDDHDQLLLRATIAHRKEKSSNDAIEIYREGDEEQRRRHMTLLQDVRGATRRGELELYYQPKISVQNESVCGAEALVRWQHPTFGWLSPNEFIPILEKSGNISVLTRWAVTTVARQCREWRDAGLDLSISVNLSAHDLQDRDLPWFVHDVLRDHDLEPHHLIAEITEEAMVRDFSHATAVLRRLRELGIRISIDDFGTGYSSLSQLRNLPVDELKIDRTFVSRLPEDRADAAIVRAVIDLAHNLGLECVAEGIETGAAFRWMQQSAVERVQGYFFSPPLPPADFRNWMLEFSGGQTVKTSTLQAG